MTDLLLLGELGRQMGPSLGAIQMTAARVVVSDTFDPAACGASDAQTRAIVLCFTTTRGLFVSCRLGAGGPCLVCFERRWMANLERWEHPAAVERLIRNAASHSPEARAYTLPGSAVAIASALLAERLAAPEATGWCDYVDLLSCERTRGVLLPIHGCRQCFSQSGSKPRHLRGLAELAQRLSDRDG